VSETNGGAAAPGGAAARPRSSSWFPFHRLLGRTTAAWGVLHGGCEIAYLLSTRERFEGSFPRVRTDGEALLYWAGLVALLLLAAHSVLASCRGRYRRFRSWHKERRHHGGSPPVLPVLPSSGLLHRSTAAALLLVASAHWWPFAFLLVPAASVRGVAMARGGIATNRHGTPPAPPPTRAPGAPARPGTGGVSRRHRSGVVAPPRLHDETDRKRVGPVFVSAGVRGNLRCRVLLGGVGRGRSPLATTRTTIGDNNDDALVVAGNRRSRISPARNGVVVAEKSCCCCCC